MGGNVSFSINNETIDVWLAFWIYELGHGSLDGCVGGWKGIWEYDFLRDEFLGISWCVDFWMSG